MKLIQKLTDSSKELSHVKTIAVCAMMLALRVVLGIFTNFTLSIVPFVKLGFSFIPIVIVAYLYGPVCAGIVGAAGDVLSLIFSNPTAFSITPGITVCCFLEGLVFGMVLYQSELKIKDIILSLALVLVLVRLPLNTLFLSFLMKMDYLSLLMYRAAVLIPFATVEGLVIFAMRKLLFRVKKSATS